MPQTIAAMILQIQIPQRMINTRLYIAARLFLAGSEGSAKTGAGGAVGAVCRYDCTSGWEVYAGGL